MKKILKQKFVSLLLTLAVCLSLVPLSVFAASETTAETTPEISAELLASLPETLDAMAIADMGHLSRLYNEETEMNTVVFDNGNGSRSAYIFDEDIKYIDSDGNTVDKSNKLEAVIGGYTNPKNDINVFYPMNIFDGITVDYKDYSINMVPAPDNTNLGNHIFATETATLASSDIRTEPDAVTYNGVFGGGTVVQYTQQFSGFKEVIGLAAYTGQTEFSFIITTNGLNLANNNGIAEFTDVETDEVIGHLGEIVMWDSNDNYYGGTYEIETIKPNNIYAVTIDASEMLNNPDTLFPVYIDPGISINAGSKTAIEDTGVYSIAPYSGRNYYMNTTNGIGRMNGVTSIPEDKGTGRIFVKMQDSLNAISRNDVTAVYLFMTTLYTTYGSINIQANLAKSNWVQNTVKYADYDWTDTTSDDYPIGEFVSTNLCNPTTNISNYKKARIDITYAWVRCYKSEGKLDNDYGIILSSPDDKGIAIYSSEHSNASYRPYIVMEYRAYDKNVDMVYGLKNVGTGQYLRVEDAFDELGTKLHAKSVPNTSNEDILFQQDYAAQFRFWYDYGYSNYRIMPICSKNGYDLALRRKIDEGVLTNEIQLAIPSVNTFSRELFNMEFDGTNYYEIQLFSETNLVLTAFESDYVTLETAEDNNNYQLWELVPLYEVYAKRHYYRYMDGVVYPIDSSQNYWNKISDGYGWRDYDDTTHPGLDIEANAGTPVKSMWKGKVLAAVENNLSNGGRGNYVVILSEKLNAYGEESFLILVYMHLNTVVDMEVNQEINAGDIVGTVGTTGGVDAHLHINIITTGCKYEDLSEDPSENLPEFPPTFSTTVDPIIFFQDTITFNYVRSSYT